MKEINYKTRDTLFISHATPEDNEFSIWLASRLEMMGYKVWIDKKYLLGGERMWQGIQNVLENQAIKVLFVHSKNIRDDNKQIKSGIFDEISFAKSISKKNSLVDFVIPLHIDDSSYSEMIGFDGIAQIPFQKSWACGLAELLKKLDEQNIIKKNKIKFSSISSWYENEYLNSCKIIDKEEIYYSTWWKILYLPDNFYIHVFKDKQQADTVKRFYYDIPIGQITNNIVSFEGDLRCKVNDEMFEHIISPIKSFEFTINDVKAGITSDGFPTNTDIQNYFKSLLSHIFFKLMKSKGLQLYNLSKDTAYFISKKEGFKYINILYPDGSKKQKKIGGKYYDCCWHYAISSKPILSPIIGYSLSSHLVFTQNGTKPLEENKMRSYRRSKARHFFNVQWRDLLFAYIQNLKDEKNEIKVKVSKKEGYLVLSSWLERYSSHFGYVDPVLDNTQNTSLEDNE